jgi:O-antigen ligase
MSWMRKLSFVLLALSVFCLPFWPFIVPRILTFYAVSAIALIFIEKSRIKFDSRFLLLILFYLLHILGLLWTENMSTGTFDLEVKLSFLIFPSLCLFLRYSRAEFKAILLIFIAALVFTFLFNLIKTTLLYQDVQLIDSYFYDSLSKPLHPGYLSMYLNFGMIILLVSLFQVSSRLFRSTRVHDLLFGLFFVFNLLVFSKNGVAVSLFLVLLLLYHLLIIKRKIILSLSAGLLSFVLMATVYYQSVFVQNNVKELVSNLVYEQVDENHKAQGSVSLRWVVWEASIEVIKKQPFLGVGTGDAVENLVIEYAEMNEVVALDKRLNSHNQFLQTFVILGLLGFSVITLIFGIGLLRSYKSKNYFAFGFLLLVFINCLTESAFETQAGTVFFAIFYCFTLSLKADET